MGVPMIGNINSPTDPNILVLSPLRNESVQSLNAGGTRHDATMKPNGHHFGRGLSFLVQTVKSILEITVKLIAIGEARRSHKRISFVSSV